MTGTLVLVRHGQSDWNLKNLFTGWRDPDLTDLGVQEANAGGKALADYGIKFDVAFTSVLRPKEMRGQNGSQIDWPYVEGLRLDEAMHSLTLLATGLYGEPMPKQNGAPIRLVVPWKYGFKSAKSLVKIELTDKEPRTTWKELAPREYGFYANVNPQVDHPRWSQATERHIGAGELPLLPRLHP